MNIAAVDTNLYRGPRPGTNFDWEALRAKGITSVLNLEGGFWGWLSQDHTYELGMAVEYGIALDHIQMGAVLPPKLEFIHLALEIIAARKGPLYVHCLEGRDRTGMVIAAYRMQYCGYSLQDAVKEMHLFNFHTYYFYWLPVLKKFQK